MRYGVDGKPREGGARLGTIGRDHLGQVGHQFGRDYQLCHNGWRGPSGSLGVGSREDERRHEPDALYAHQRLAKRSGWQRVHRFDFPRGKHRAFDGHDCTADPAAVDRNSADLQTCLWVACYARDQPGSCGTQSFWLGLEPGRKFALPLGLLFL